VALGNVKARIIMGSVLPWGRGAGRHEAAISVDATLGLRPVKLALAMAFSPEFVQRSRFGWSLRV
jgi:hypothetical protein